MNEWDFDGLDIELGEMLRKWQGEKQISNEYMLKLLLKHTQGLTVKFYDYNK